jgi:hypothetical protein
MGLVHAQIEALLGLAAVQRSTGRPDEADASGRQALGLARAAGHRLYERFARDSITDLPRPRVAVEPAVTVSVATDA